MAGSNEAPISKKYVGGESPSYGRILVLDEFCEVFPTSVNFSPLAFLGSGELESEEQKAALDRPRTPWSSCSLRWPLLEREEPRLGDLFESHCYHETP